MKGQGHLRRRSRAWFEAKFDAPTPDGRRRTVYRTIKASTAREAQVELTRLLAQAHAGGHTDPNRLTVAEHVASRVAHWHATGITSAKTHERYLELVEFQIVPFLGAKLLQKLRSVDIESWHTTLLTKGRLDGTGGLSARTIGHVHKLLSRALRDGVRHGLVLKNVAAEQKPPKLFVKPMQILSPEQVKNLPELLAGRSIRAPALVGLFTGMRRGELLALRWPDVDLDRKQIKVHTALEQAVAHGVRSKKPKTASGARVVALPDIVVDTLRQHRREQLEMRLTLGLGRAPADALVFPFPGTDEVWKPDTFSSTWKDVAGELGLGSFHALRHTHASQLIAAGVPITEIAHRLGHASPATTLSIYSHLFEKDNSRAAAAINAALKG
jgi:integrase